ncbi:MAG: hypothetical protein S4CHLAM45_09550 [Chlamydiales bacterium]|nr:hypothetical protein [Chlamydiales bacterium]MCH9620227.1 hypothetical protein [Chlamydiales bacterium]MCH9623058.1 hypothetical protein [Chlamydiales bacterium]
MKYLIICAFLLGGCGGKAVSDEPPNEVEGELYTESRGVIPFYD